MATSRMKGGKTTHGQAGDIQAVDPIGKPLMDIFTLELKKGYPKCNLSDALDVNPPTLPPRLSKKTGKMVTPAPYVPTVLQFASQAHASWRAASSYTWAIIHKRDHHHTTIIFPSTGDWGKSPWVDAARDLNYLSIQLTHNVPGLPCPSSLVQVRLEEFLKWFSPRDLKRFIHRLEME